jgi:hypothetical protein
MTFLRSAPLVALCLLPARIDPHDAQASQRSPRTPSCRERRRRRSIGRSVSPAIGRRPTGGWAGWLAEQGLVLDLGALVYHSRWITPAQSPKRFDTCFFLAVAPEDQVAAHDRIETTDQCWIIPQDALERAAEGDMLIWYPTEQTLRALAGADTVAALLTAARRQREVRGLQPHIEQGPGGWRVLPDDPAYPHERHASGGDLREQRR